MTSKTSDLTSTGLEFESWDPLEGGAEDRSLFLAAQRREIKNILKSYTGYYDFLSEPLQNALDAIEKRLIMKEKTYKPQIYTEINLKENSVIVADNGYGMEMQEFKGFLRPNYSFKDPKNNRGNKGVGATYLAYGFNHIEAATKTDSTLISGTMLRGREWLEDKEGLVPNPKIQPNNQPSQYFSEIDRGTVVKIVLGGDHTRPKSLSWVGAKNAKEWMAILRVYTPIGGIYLGESKSPKIPLLLKVIDIDGNETTEFLDQPKYLYPHEQVNNAADLRQIIQYEHRQTKRGLSPALPIKYKNLFGIWGEWTAEQIFDKDSDSPINPKLSKEEIELVGELGIKIYVFLAFSTELWDKISEKFNVRKGARILHGGLQLATRNMPQGSTITIPLTNNVGFQNQTHIIIHFENAEPDLGRKGFQPEHIDVAEKIAVSAVTAFRRRVSILKSSGSGKDFDGELKIQQWVRSQEERMNSHPLVIRGEWLFAPTEELPIKSEPLVEQDVVALFNQMLSAGVIRGIDLISSSQFNQYDGLYRIKMQSPFDKYIYSEERNPLGIYEEHFKDKEERESITKVLEYKYNLNGLIEELQSEVKSTDDIGIAICWEIGNKWRENFSIISLLDPDNTHLRAIHGVTHMVNHLSTGKLAFNLIALQDLTKFLMDQEGETEHQRELYGDDELID